MPLPTVYRISKVIWLPYLHQIKRFMSVKTTRDSIALCVTGSHYKFAIFVWKFTWFRHYFLAANISHSNDLKPPKPIKLSPLNPLLTPNNWRPIPSRLGLWKNFFKSQNPVYITENQGKNTNEAATFDQQPWLTYIPPVMLWKWTIK